MNASCFPFGDHDAATENQGEYRQAKWFALHDVPFQRLTRAMPEIA